MKTDLLSSPYHAYVSNYMFQECSSPELDLSDDEDLQQAFDMHSLIISSLQQEPMFTAEEVISEIEGMMEQVRRN